MPTQPSIDPNFQNFCDIIAQSLRAGDLKTVRRAESLLDTMLRTILEMNQLVATLNTTAQLATRQTKAPRVKRRATP